MCRTRDICHSNSKPRESNKLIHVRINFFFFCTDVRINLTNHKLALLFEITNWNTNKILCQTNYHIIAYRYLKSWWLAFRQPVAIAIHPSFERAILPITHGYRNDRLKLSHCNKSQKTLEKSLRLGKWWKNLDNLYEIIVERKINF